MKRSSYCGDLRKNNIGEEIVVCGWVHSRRDHGGLIFIDLRDRSGILQIVFLPESRGTFRIAENLKNEYVLSIKGLIRCRPEGTINPNISTGQIELVVAEVEVLNTCLGLPFEISDYVETSEELRLKYRYLDLRRPNFQKKIITRHKISNEVRNFLNEEGFLEIETPLLTKSTPEGARDFLIPSRLQHGNFFALPQSPQLFKQILMISGFDKYYQFARCFRDEDLRADRQLEFTQIDIEMSFVDEDDVISLIERMLSRVFKTVLSIDISTPFERISYNDAMLRFGSDKPDTRFGMEIKDFSQEFKNSEFGVFSSAISNGDVIRGLCIPNGSVFSRSEIDGLIKLVCEFGAKGLVWIKVTSSGVESNIVKYFKEYEVKTVVSKLNARPGDLIVLLADEEKLVAQCLGVLRLKMGKKLGFISKNNKFNFLWVVDFPLMNWNNEEHRWQSLHHPFTSPKENIDAITKENIGRVKSRAYDIILNGVELGGGSIRIHKTDIQKKIFEILNISDESAKEKFGFLFDALLYGAPPHGGLALGFDRICALVTGEESIREVVAFPKTQKSFDPLSNAPTPVDDEHLKELGIKVISKLIKL
ncbi:MAG: aspartate--tRNA ligase [Endomicrobium sp.]|jgi:aspartyl-tRNA synthetase|nr:aspartate--tRNA ligase [Endomicrobium sp.]